MASQQCLIQWHYACVKIYLYILSDLYYFCHGNQSDALPMDTSSCKTRQPDHRYPLESLVKLGLLTANCSFHSQCTCQCLDLFIYTGYFKHRLYCKTKATLASRRNTLEQHISIYASETHCCHQHYSQHHLNLTAPTSIRTHPLATA